MPGLPVLTAPAQVGHRIQPVPLQQHVHRPREGGSQGDVKAAVPSEQRAPLSIPGQPLAVDQEHRDAGAIA